MSHGLIEYCRVDNAGHMGNGVQSPANFESEASEYLVWQFNESSNCRTTGSNDGAGFDVFDGGAQYATVQYNWVHENDGYGVGGGGVGSGFDGGSVTGNTVRFNVLANNNQRSINGDLQFWGGFTNLAVYNNTIFSNLNTSTLIAIPAAVTSSYIRNNILVSLGTRSLLSGGTTANTPAFQGNLYWRGSGGAALGLTMNSTTSNTIADWRATGQELYRNAGSGLVSDPAFSSAGSLLAELPTSLVSVMASYDTTGGSAARGSAISPSDWGEYPGPIDFHGKFLNLSVFDIGAPQATTR